MNLSDTEKEIIVETFLDKWKTSWIDSDDIRKSLIMKGLVDNFFKANCRLTLEGIKVAHKIISEKGLTFSKE